ncbi:MAG: SIR2 family NAD-dependent protein deacylase [Aristaeellaceae bacterium]
MKQSTGSSFAQQIDQLGTALQSADAVLIGAGAGLSAAAGMTYSGKRFMKYFADFAAAYGIRDMYSGGFYPFPSLEEYWAWWSRHIVVNRYDAPVGKPYRDLLKLVDGKDYFVLTTNVDHQFQLAGFDKARLFYMQGDYGLWQCAKPCHHKTYDNEQTVRQMVCQQKDLRIPSELIPHCPLCGAPMTMNLRCDETFVQDEGWYAARQRYEDFLQTHAHANMLLLELGVGFNTPGIIKLPFWQMTQENPNACYACLNKGEVCCPCEIAPRSICIDLDLADSLHRLVSTQV